MAPDLFVAVSSMIFSRSINRRVFKRLLIPIAFTALDHSPLLCEGLAKGGQMQNRYAGDIGDYVKLALIRAIASDLSLGVAWYLFPDENHNSDGRHVSYLDQPERWRHLDPDLFDTLKATVREQRTVAALEASGALPGALYSREPITTDAIPAGERCDFRHQWFGRTTDQLRGCDLVFADPDNGLVDDHPRRRRDRKFGKQLPISEALSLAHGRQAVIYHHNTRYPGRHDLEVEWWRSQLGDGTIAVRANAYSCRTFFIVNPSEAVKDRTAQFCERWSGHRVRLTA
ncbi:hypothetical protein KK137_00025 [Croceibacterium sp. LX-88]|uniref:Uncharacterized protein n=1 Tax=Croceibacterium selenioxidans TaxID=2838833 RepID=A0ABS5W0F0_9SPHN|nr:hypothetical protein [Croceibacterium selenioxidans]MBT2132705.1 hypothetical protein [Croceibacterium selenioxidans]